MKKFNSQICTTKEQSKRLWALGLKTETADMLWMPYLSKNPIVGNQLQSPNNLVQQIAIPAWSLHRLMILAEMKGSAFSDLDSAYETTISIIAAKIRFGYFKKEYLEENN